MQSSILVDRAPRLTRPAVLANASRRHVAFVCAQPLLPADSGARIRNLAFLRALSREADVQVFYLADRPQDIVTSLELGGVCIPAVGVLRSSAVSGPDALHQRWRSDCDPRADEPLPRALRAVAGQRPFDVAVAEQVFSFGVARHAGAPVLLDEHNVESATWRDNFRLLGWSGHDAERALRALVHMERRAWRNADVVTCCSSDDARRIQEQRRRPVEVVSNGVDVAAVPFCLPSARGGKTLLFVGSFFWMPNVDAARRLTAEVLPRVRRYWPEARAVLCGHDPQGLARALAGPGVDVHGRVETVVPYLSGSTVYCNTLQSGGGSSLKTIEALASGIPLVSTAVGARGFELAGTYLRGETAGELAEGVCAVLASPQAFDRQALAGRAASAVYDWERLGSQFASIALQEAGRADAGRAVDACRLSARALEGTRALLLVAAEAHDPVTASLLVDALRARGADVRRLEVDQCGLDALLPALRDACPSVVLCIGRAEVFAAIAQRTALPVLHVVSDPAARFDHLGRARARATREVAIALSESTVPSAPLPCPAFTLAPLCRADDLSAETIAKIVSELGHTVACLTPRPIRELALNEDELVAYLCSQGLPGAWDELSLRDILAQARALGMPHHLGREGIEYDRFASWQWLFEHSPAFHERLARGWREVKRRAGYGPEHRRTLPCCRDRSPSRPRIELRRPVRYRVRTSVAPRFTADDAGKRFRLYLPYPIATDAQRSIELVATSPRSMAASVIPEHGYVYGFEFSPDDLEGPTLEAVCDLTVFEVHTHEVDGHLERIPGDLSAAQMLQRVSESGRSPYERARSVHDWMCRVGRYKKIPRPCTCMPCAARDFDQSRAGDCLLFAHAFQKYCADVGIRSRSIAGVHLAFPRDERGAVVGFELQGERVIGHEWTELELPDLGWLPVEFGAEGTTRDNCYDDALLELLERDVHHYREFWFGNLDNLRIRYPLGTLRTPTLLVHAPERARGDRWTPVDERRLRFTVDAEYLE